MNIRIAAIILILLAPALAWGQKKEGREEKKELVARFKIVRVTEGSTKDNFMRLRISDDDGYLNCLLVCMNTAYDRAMIDTADLARAARPHLVEYAIEQIGQGISRGSHMMVDGAIRYSVTWHSADMGNMTIEEVQERKE